MFGVYSDNTGMMIPVKGHTAIYTCYSEKNKHDCVIDGWSLLLCSSVTSRPFIHAAPRGNAPSLHRACSRLRLYGAPAQLRTLCIFSVVSSCVQSRRCRRVLYTKSGSFFHLKKKKRKVPSASLSFPPPLPSILSQPFFLHHSTPSFACHAGREPPPLPAAAESCATAFDAVVFWCG